MYCPVLDCVAPMTFFKCLNPGIRGTECQRTCEKQDPNNCVSNNNNYIYMYMYIYIYIHIFISIIIIGLFCL